jgi:hypothetical protein
MASVEWPVADERLLQDILDLSPLSREELFFKGAATAIAERILELKRADAQLGERYDSVEQLEARIRAKGVSPDDHTLYTDLLEWRAMRHELAELLDLLEALG